MFLKSMGLLTPVALGGMYMTGAFGGSYERTVNRPPLEVMAAVGDLDLTGQPGRPAPTRHVRADFRRRSFSNAGPTR